MECLCGLASDQFAAVEGLLAELEDHLKRGETIGASQRLGAVRSLLQRAATWPDVPKVDMLAVRVIVHGRHARLSPTETALFIKLALDGGCCPARDLGEALFSHLGLEGAAQTLKVVVHRIRRKLEWPDVLLVSPQGYQLHSSLRCDLPLAESEIAAALRGAKPLPSDRRERCQTFRRRLHEPCVDALLRWDWFCQFDRLRERLFRDVSLALGEDALASSNAAAALRYGYELARRDPIDEEARHLVLRAHLANGDVMSAYREYDEYALALTAELGTHPSPHLTALLKHGIDLSGRPAS